MKRIIKLSMFMLLLLSCMIFSNSTDVSAAVKYSVNKAGTLTVSGKGAVTSKEYRKKHKEIKKIVIKSGVTSIKTLNAFKGCTNCTEVDVATSVKSIAQGTFDIAKLKKITIPGTFKVILSSERDEQIECITDPFLDNSLEDVVFNTNLDIKVCTYFTTKNFVTYSKDKNYKSYSGIVYTKDGTELVRVPYKRESLVIREGCTDFDLWAVTYALNAGDWLEVSSRIKEITIPSTMIRINDTKNKGQGRAYYDEFTAQVCEKFTIKSKQLTGKSISVLLEKFKRLDIDELLNQIPESITVDDRGFYITKDQVMLFYNEKESVMNIPNGVKVIGLRVLGDTAKKNVKQVIMPDSVTEVMRLAFSQTPTCPVSINDVKLSAGLEKIGASAFANCPITEISFPNSLKQIDDAAFKDCPLKHVNFGTGITKIGPKAFSSNSVETLVLPKNLTTVGAGAFGYNRELKSVTINSSSTKGFASDVFCYDDNATIKYGSNVAKTQYLTSLRWTSLHNVKPYQTVSLKWIKNANVTGYQIQLSTKNSFSSSTTVSSKVTSASTVSTNVKYKKNKIAKYARIRPYTTKSGKTTYGKWSAITL